MRNEASKETQEAATRIQRQVRQVNILDRRADEQIGRSDGRSGSVRNHFSPLLSHSKGRARDSTPAHPIGGMLTTSNCYTILRYIELMMLYYNYNYTYTYHVILSCISCIISC